LVPQEFDEAFTRLFPRCCRVADRLLGDRAAAEDVAAEALARAYARWSKLEDTSYVDAWVLRVGANLAIDQLRRRKVDRVELRAEGFEDVVALRVTLEAALAQLPGRQRQIITLRYLADLSEAQIVELTGLSAGTVKTHLRRAGAAMRRLLGGTTAERGADVLA
jgi:RNA polymerase sigma-70 factor (sigma-E family)